MGARNPVRKGVSKKLKGASLRVRMKSVGKVDDRLCMRILRGFRPLRRTGQVSRAACAYLVIEWYTEEADMTSGMGYI
jgi:hypothetical protein